MAYSREALQRVGPQNSGAPSFFTFKDEASTLAAIDASGFFNDAADILKVSDLIYIRGSNGQGLAVVVSNTRDLAASPPVAGVVDTSNVVALGAIDSD